MNCVERNLISFCCTLTTCCSACFSQIDLSRQLSSLSLVHDTHSHQIADSKARMSSPTMYLESVALLKWDSVRWQIDSVKTEIHFLTTTGWPYEGKPEILYMGVAHRSEWEHFEISPMNASFKLESPMQLAQQISLCFIYSSTDWSNYFDTFTSFFQPQIYSSDNQFIEKDGNLDAVEIGELKESRNGAWIIDEFSFVVTAEQAGHEWIIIHPGEKDGFIRPWVGCQREPAPYDLAEKTVYFEFDSSVLNADYKLMLAQFAKKTDSFKSIKVQGYCDDIGSEGYNLILSHKRAVAVKKYLIHCGVSSAMIEVEGMGMIRGGNNEIKMKSRKVILLGRL
jgi:hypothetical protein